MENKLVNKIQESVIYNFSECDSDEFFNNELGGRLKDFDNIPDFGDENSENVFSDNESDGFDEEVLSMDDEHIEFEPVKMDDMIEPIDVTVTSMGTGHKSTTVEITGDVINLNTRNLRINDISASVYFNKMRNQNMKESNSCPDLANS